MLLLNYWLFPKMQNSIFITQESSRYLGFKKHSLRKKDWFSLLFCVKTSRTKKAFWILMQISMTPIIEIQRARLYIQNANKLRNAYIYPKSQTLCKKQDNLRCFFIHKKAIHFTLRDFSWIFEIGIYIYTKSMTLCVMWRFIYKKPDTSRKQENLRYIFIYKKQRKSILT